LTFALPSLASPWGRQGLGYSKSDFSSNKKKPEMDTIG